MGTVWYISTFGEVPSEFWKKLEQESATFEAQYSRFIMTSEANTWRDISEPVTATITEPLAQMLHFAQELKHLTHGRFDPAVGGLLEEIGYDSQYSFRPREPQKWHSPEWSIRGDQLSISKKMVIDIGGFGKGFWIDQLSKMLTEAGFPHHLIDGGGDMYATTKPDGSGWRVAIEQPGKPDTARDVVMLRNEALAVSDTLKRQWGTAGQIWNHVLDPIGRTNPHFALGVAVIAPRAMVADALTTAIMVSPQEEWRRITDSYQAEYSVITPGELIHTHPHWPGEMIDTPDVE
jgi:thiamine biosynthesis lipoprotein